MDTRTVPPSAHYHLSAPDPQPVAVTRWTAQLADPQCETEYRFDRFAEDRRRAFLLLGLVSAAGFLNFLVQLQTYWRGDSSYEALMIAVAPVCLPLIGALIVQRLRTPGMLEAMMVLFVAVGTSIRLTMMTVYPAMAYIWPTAILGIIFVIYIYLPVRFITSALMALVFSIVASGWWLLMQNGTMPQDQIYRGLVWLLFANALGLLAANAMQCGQRARYAQSLLLKELLSTDALTGIGNRRRFDDALSREWRRCSRSGRPVSLLMVDVDHFKAYNDHCGHQKGDECLRRVARLLVDCVGRPGDLVARYGGEEFVCLLPEIGEDGAQAVAAKFIMAVARAGIPHPALPPDGRLTISVGVATAKEVAIHAPGALVALADKLLYDAKRAGRDRSMAGVF